MAYESEDTINDDIEEKDKTLKKRKKGNEDPEAKRLRLEREKLELQEALKRADFSTKQTRVAGILNMYPSARNSDITLCIRYWEHFEPHIYNPNGIRPEDLFRLERLHYLVRARAKIQNEYGLFPADEKIRRFRRKHEEEIVDAVVDDETSERVINVFADESGKNGRFVIIAAVWVLRGYGMFRLFVELERWRKNTPWAHRELHFKDFRSGHVDHIRSYLDVVNAHREFFAFKVLAMEKARTKRPIEEIVRKLHEQMLIRGAEHEVDNRRIELPHEIDMTVDAEQSLDAIALQDLRQNVRNLFRNAYGGNLTLKDVSALDSDKSAMIQLADLIAGAVNRRLNREGEERNHKDVISDMILENFNLNDHEIDVEGIDSSALFYM